MSSWAVVFGWAAAGCAWVAVVLAYRGRIEGAMWWLYVTLLLVALAVFEATLK